MEENNMAEIAETTPQDAAIESEQEESANQPEGATPKDQSAESAGQSQEESEQEGGSADGAEASPSSATVPIRFNHEYRELSIEEAADWAQKGMQAEELMGSLRLLACAEGRESVRAMIKSLIDGHDEMLREKYREKVGDEELVERLVAAEREKYTAGAAKMAADEKAAEQESREAATKRLAEEFMELQKEFPEIKDFQGIPDSVLHQSIGKKISLLDAYLRYQRSEQKKRDQAEASAKAAKESSTGSMQSQAEGAENAIISAALKGVFG